MGIFQGRAGKNAPSRLLHQQAEGAEAVVFDLPWSEGRSSPFFAARGPCVDPERAALAARRHDRRERTAGWLGSSGSLGVPGQLVGLIRSDTNRRATGLTRSG